MNKTREIIVTQTFNEMGVQIDLKTTPLVRCKDCKYGEVNRKSPIYGMWCERFGAEKSNLAVLPTDYCSYGERKDDE